MIYSKKSLGQNFLADPNIIKKITNLTEISNKDILEIGPGTGALTNEIIKKKPRSLILIEKDANLVTKLKVQFKNIKNIKIYNKDILKFNFENILKPKTIIFGNLPYNISSQILVKSIKFKIWPPKYNALIFMFQKEMADRILAKYKTSKYGRLSILANYRLNIVDKFNISPNCFIPKPKVNSSVIFFKPYIRLKNNIVNLDNLEKVTSIFFSNKRKMINKSVKKILKTNELQNLSNNIDFKLRPSDLSPDIYYKITELFEKY